MLVAASCPAVSTDGRIGGFVIGHSMYVWGNPFRILFLRDPIFDYSIYPLPPDLSDPEKRRLDRVYYPRTKALLVDTYDLIVFHDSMFSRQPFLHPSGFRESRGSSETRIPSRSA